MTSNYTNYIDRDEAIAAIVDRILDWSQESRAGQQFLVDILTEGGWPALVTLTDDKLQEEYENWIHDGSRLESFYQPDNEAQLELEMESRCA